MISFMTASTSSVSSRASSPSPRPRARAPGALGIVNDRARGARGAERDGVWGSDRASTRRASCRGASPRGRAVARAETIAHAMDARERRGVKVMDGLSLG